MEATLDIHMFTISNKNLWIQMLLKQSIKKKYTFMTNTNAKIK